jgi:hypothetical protein
MAEQRHARSFDRGGIVHESVDAEPEHGGILTARSRGREPTGKNPNADFS